ncbi:MAG: FGGY family carbohydrate kinase [Desulfobaccales bacterium]
MRSDSRLLVIDEGTTGTRALVFDGIGRVRSQSYSEFTQYHPGRDRVEHDPEEIWQVTCACITRALRDCGTEHARRQHHHIEGLRLFVARSGVFRHHHHVAPGGLGDLGHLAPDEMDPIVVPHLPKKLLITARRANIDVKDMDFGLRVFLPEISGLLQGGHAADIGTIGQMVLIPGTGALDKGHLFGGLLVRRPEDQPAGGAVGGRQALHLHVGDDVGYLAEPQIIHLGGIVKFPTAGQDDGPHLELQGLGQHVQLDGFVLAGLLALPAAVAAARRGVDDVLLGKGEIEGDVSCLGLVQTIIEIINPPGGAGLGAGITGHTAVIDIARRHLHGDLEVARRAADLGDFRHGVETDVGIFPDPPEVDL